MTKPLVVAVVLFVAVFIFRKLLQRVQQCRAQQEFSRDIRSELSDLEARLQSQGIHSEDVVKLFTQFLVDMKKLGFSKKDSLTVREYAHYLGAQFKGIQGAMTLFCKAFEDCRYGHRKLSSEEFSVIKQSIFKLYFDIFRQARAHRLV